MVSSKTSSGTSPPSPTVKQVKKIIRAIHEFSKVGFNGFGNKKVNQDNYFVFKNFVGNSSHYYMGVW